MAQERNWSKPYYGLSHLGELSDRRRASVQEHGDGSATLTMWVRGGGFCPAEEPYATVAAAKEAGEQWAVK